MRATLITGLVGALLLNLPAADRAFRRGDFARAAAEYERAIQRGNRSPAVYYNLGTALLRAGRHAEARRHLEAAAHAGDPVVAQAAAYNAGNTYLEPWFRGPASPEQREALQSAIAHYKRALRLNPTDQDAKWNLELAQRLLVPPGGGGGAEDPQWGGGGGTGADQPSPAQPDPAPAAGSGALPQMSPAEAEQVIQAAALRDRELQQEKLRRAPSPPPNVRDW